MILKYFFPERNFSWEELDKITGKRESELWTWPTLSFIKMQELGFEVKNIGIFDYDEFVKRGINYLKDTYDDNVAEKQRQNSDINYEIENAKKLKNLIKKEKRIAGIKDISKLITKGYLVECSINSMALAGREGYRSHSVLVVDTEEDHITLHDPGPPPMPFRRVTIDDFNGAWAYPCENSKNVTAFRLSK